MDLDVSWQMDLSWRKRLDPQEMIASLETKAEQHSCKEFAAMVYNETEVDYHLQHAYSLWGGESLGEPICIYLVIDRCHATIKGCVSTYTSTLLSTFWATIAKLTLIGHDASNKWIRIYPRATHENLNDARTVGQLEKDDNQRIVIRVETTLARVGRLFDLCLPRAAEVITKGNQVSSELHVPLQRHMDYSKRVKVFDEVHQWNGNGFLTKENFKDGQLHGVRMEYFSDGSLKIAETYQRGVLHGKRSRWDARGNPILEEKYERGTRHGYQKEWHFDGIFSMVEYFDFGDLEETRCLQTSGRFESLDSTKRKRGHIPWVSDSDNNTKKARLDNNKKDFKQGASYYLTSVAKEKERLIRACANKYPGTDGRGVNIVYVPHSWLGDCWMSEFILDPGRFHVNKSRLKVALVGLEGDDDDLIETIGKEINAYDPKKELLFFIFTSSSKSGIQHVIEKI